MTTPTLTDTEYLALAEAVLNGVEASCDRINDTTDLDVDNQRVGSMITLTFENDTQIVINLQPPLHEVWLAARSGGFHYQWNADTRQWLCSKNKTEFFADLTAYASTQSGDAMEFVA